MRNIILARNDIDWKNESEVAKKYFPTTFSRMEIKPGDLVISRFSALPFYKEQEYDINYVGANMINTYRNHNYISDLRNWYEDLEKFTPKTYYRVQDCPNEGPFVLKGETNSKKYLWKTHMFASNKKEALEVEDRLVKDSLIQYQSIYVRQYIPLKKYLTGFQNLPITNEYRFFVYKDTILSSGYYWSSHIEELNEMGIFPNSNQVPLDFIHNIINIVKNKTNFYVIDVAETEDNKCILIELNDGQQSGLSCNDPNELYSNLKMALNEENTYR